MEMKKVCSQFNAPGLRYLAIFNLWPRNDNALTQPLHCCQMFQRRLQVLDMLKAMTEHNRSPFKQGRFDSFKNPIRAE